MATFDLALNSRPHKKGKLDAKPIRHYLGKEEMAFVRIVEDALKEEWLSEADCQAYDTL